MVDSIYLVTLRVLVVFLFLFVHGFHSQTKAQENKAKDLFERMQSKIRSFDNVRVNVTIRALKTDFHVKGRMVFALKNNKFRVEIQSKEKDQTTNAVWVCDGKHLESRTTVSESDDKIREVDKDKEIVDKEAAKRMVTVLAKFSAAWSLGCWDSKNGCSATKDWPPFEYKFIGNEKLRDVNTQVFLVVFDEGSDNVKLTFRVWLNPKTNLPLRRAMYMPNDPNTISLEETYSNWSFDAPTDENEFRLPQ